MAKGGPSFMDRRLKERLIGATILVVLIVLIVPELLSGPKQSVAPPRAAAGGATSTVRNVTVDLGSSKATPWEDSGVAATPPAPGPMPPEAAPTSGTVPPVAALTPGATPPAAAPPLPAPTAAPSVGTRAAVPSAVENQSLPSTVGTRAAAPSAVEKESLAPTSTSGPSHTPDAHDTPAVAVQHSRWSVQVGSFASQSNAEQLMRWLEAHDHAAYVSQVGRGTSLRYRVRLGPYTDRGMALKSISTLRKEGKSASLVAP